MPKVSIILTSFNHSETIRESIDGVLSQSYDDYELIIWDDASNDASWEIINTYTDPRIKIFRNEINRRGIWGINKAITEVVKGEYVAIHHSGDEWHKDKLKKQVEFLDKNTTYSAVFTKVRIVDEKGNNFQDKDNFYYDVFEQNNKSKAQWLRFFITQGNALCHPSILIRKTCFDECGLYRYGLAQTGDFDMWLRLCLKHEIYILDDKLTYFRIESNDGNTSSHNKVTETRSYYECYRIISDLISQFENSDWKEVFPEYYHYSNGQHDVNDYIFARLLLDLDTMPPIKILGLDILFNLLQNEELSLKIKNLYNFSYHDFIELTYNIDPFNISMVIDLKSEVQLVLSQKDFLINQHNKELELITSSISWKITKPARFIGRLLTNPKIYFPIFKSWIKKTPMLPLARWSQQKYHSIRNVIFNAPLSNQNIKYTNQTSKKRADEFLSKRHISCITNDVNLKHLPILDISVVTFNNGKWLTKFSNSLFIQSYPLDKINLHFIDNGSEDGTLKLLREFKDLNKERFRDIQVYSRPNLGFGAGHDYAIKKFECDFFLVTNIDLEFTRDSLINVVKFAINDNENVACWELRQKPYEHPKYYDPVTLETAWCSHACILIRKEAYLRVGGYEPRIFMYGEDVELSYRFRYFGYSLRYIPHASVYHYTYEEEFQVKPLQFSGSSLANILIRLRYGNLEDKITGIILQLILLIRGAKFKNSRKVILKNVLRIPKEVKYFWSNNDKLEKFFPFRYFDYEMVRDGSFYKYLDIPKDISHLPLVTIITRTYKGRDFLLKECMTSVINQTYNNIQHVIIEDGGDSYLELVNETKEKYGKFYNVDFHGVEKKGRSFAGNYGLKHAKGDLLLFLDDDDLIFPDHIEVLVSELISDNSLSAVYSLAWDVHTNIDKVSGTYNEYVFETNEVFYQEFDYNILLERNYIPIQSILFKKKLYEERGGFNESVDYLEDWDLWTRYATNRKFKLVRKTTSMFRTPADANERLKRAALLDSAFEDALQRQASLKNYK